MQPKLKETENPYGILSEYGHFIGGEWVSSSGGETIDLMNPATGEVLSRIQSGTPDDINRAVAAAKAAFPAWSQSSASQRQEILYEMARRLKARMQDYAVFETLNNGKPIREGMFFDLPTAIMQFEVFAGAAYGIHGETHNYADAIGIVHREPLGVCAQIIPWNVPMIMMASKIAPALAAGNTIVLKPAETVCLSVMEFFREMADLIPAGVVNVVTGYGAAVGEALVTHPDVRKVAFTGSVATARRIIQYASENVIPQTLELGGKSAHIVCADADIDAAVEAATMSTVLNKGEVCLAGSRMFCSNRNPCVQVVFEQPQLTDNPLAGVIPAVCDVLPSGEASRVVPLVEAWTVIGGLAMATQRIRFGVMVTGNTYRNPAFLLKQHLCRVWLLRESSRIKK